jgi:hypothetical protein
MIVYKFEGNNWQQIVVPSPVPGGSATSGATTAIRHTNITFNSIGNPVISYFNSGNSNRNTVIVYDKSSGSGSLNAIISSRDITNNSLSTDPSGNMYASFTDIITNGSWQKCCACV